MSERITSETVGNFIDDVAGKFRKPSAVVGRLIEEAVELGLAADLTPEEIMGHVNDSIFNQCVKVTELEEKSCFPSRYGRRGNLKDLIEEAADVGLLLKDLAHVANFCQDSAEAKKWDAFTKKQFWVSPKGVVYGRSRHIK